MGRTALPIDALDSPKGDVDELDDDEPIPSDAEIFGDSREPLEGMSRSISTTRTWPRRVTARSGCGCFAPSRIAGDPAQIGEAFVYGDNEDDDA